MIRRDYFLRMIEEFFQVLARLKSLKQGQLWQQADATVDGEFRRLIGLGPEAVAQLTETELLARLMQGEPTQVVHDKALMLATLLKEAGDLAAAQNHPQESRLGYLKGLHLLLDTLARGEVSDLPDFVPRLEVFITALADTPLPPATQARLMQHYERAGQFSQAEDALFALLEAEPNNPAVQEFGIAFYRRLAAQSDTSLQAGNLPRSELAAGLAELQSRKR